jgi:hypothetical protein
MDGSLSTLERFQPLTLVLWSCGVISTFLSNIPWNLNIYLMMMRIGREEREKKKKSMYILPIFITDLAFFFSFGPIVAMVVPTPLDLDLFVVEQKVWSLSFSC